MRQTMHRFSRQPSYEQLDARRVMAADLIVEVEPNNIESQPTPFNLVAGQQVRLTGLSQGKDDKDFFAFTAPAAMDVTVNAAAAPGAKLEVTTRAGSQLFETEPKDGLVSGQWAARPGETYLVRLRSADKSPAAYDVVLEALGNNNNNNNNNNNGSTGNGNGNGNGGAGSAGTEVEPNDRPANATSTQLTASGLTLSGSASNRDRDFFRVQSTSAGSVAIDTGASGIKVSIETIAGTKLFESEPRDGVTKGAFSVSAGEVFLVRARGLSNSVTQYSLLLALGNANATSTPPATTAASTSSPDAWLDPSDDGMITALDALLVINHINAHGIGHGADDALLNLDTNDDQVVTALDALMVVNRINDTRRGVDVNDAFDDSDIKKRRA